MRGDVAVVALMALMMASLLPSSRGCSCMPSHPQTQFCKADFVILATIKRANDFNSVRTYKLRIRKEYKMSEKAVVALKSGRLITSKDEAMCGVSLDPGRTYVISGRILSLKAHISLCDLTMPWRGLTKRQRKGFKMMYRHGCGCNVQFCRMGRCAKNVDTCSFTSPCHHSQGICLRSKSKKCSWTRNKELTACLKPTLPLTISRWSG